MGDAATRRIDRADTPGRVVALAEYLRDPARAFAVVLVTPPSQPGHQGLDAEQLAGRVGDLADVWFVTSPPLTQVLTKQLGRDATVFNGSVRCYPVGTGWLEQPALAPRWAKPAPHQVERTVAEIESTLRVWREQARPRATDSRATRPGRSVPDAKPRPPEIPMPTKPRAIATVEEARLLAKWLTQASRRWPVVVVTRAYGETNPAVDAADIADQLAGLAEVVVLPTDSRSWALAAELPPETEVYGGAARVYPVGTDWTHAPRRAPLIFVNLANDAARAAERLVGLAVSAALDAGLAPPTPPAGAQRVSGTVATVLGERAVVTLDGGGMAAVRREQVCPSLPLTRVLAPGMAIRGAYDPVTKVLDPRSQLVSAADALVAYGPDCTVLAEVTKATPGRVRMVLFPGVEVERRAADLDLDEGLELTDLFAPGDVIAVRILARSGLSFDVELLPDIAADTMVAPAVLPGGPPWVAPVPMAPPAAEVDPTPVAVAPPVQQPQPTPHPVPRPGAAASMSLKIDELRARVGVLEHQVDRAEAAARTSGLRMRELETHIGELRAQVRADEAELERHRRQRRQDALKLRRAKNTERPASLLDAADGAFPDAEQQFRFEVYLSWVERVPAAEKATKPLLDYSLGPDFLVSLRNTEGIERRKVVQEVADLLVSLGQPGGTQTIDMHPLRAGSGGDDGKRVRADGAIAWRVALQRNTAAARRLHFWRVGGKIELAKVALHDDFDA